MPCVHEPSAVGLTLHKGSATLSVQGGQHALATLCRRGYVQNCGACAQAAAHPFVHMHEQDDAALQSNSADDA